MGDLQTFVNSAYVEEKRPGARTGNFSMYWPVLLPVLIGAAWMYFSWQQVRKATEKKELVTREFELLSKEHARLKQDYMALKSAMGTAKAAALPEDQAISVPPEADQPVVDQSIPVQPTPAVVTRTNVSPAGRLGPVGSTDEAEQFLIVAGAGRNLEGAQIDVDRLQSVGVDFIAIYHKDSYYRIVAGPFPKDQATPQLQTIKTKVNATAYMIPSDQWCDSPTWRDGYYVCGD